MYARRKHVSAAIVGGSTNDRNRSLHLLTPVLESNVMPQRLAFLVRAAGLLDSWNAVSLIPAVDATLEIRSKHGLLLLAWRILRETIG